MSTDKKSVIEKTVKSLEYEKLSENEAGQLAGGFSDAMNDQDESFPEINISKCHCTTAPTTPTAPSTAS